MNNARENVCNVSIRDHLHGKSTNNLHDSGPLQCKFVFSLIQLLVNVIPVFFLPCLQDMPELKKALLIP